MTDQQHAVTILPRRAPTEQAPWDWYRPLCSCNWKGWAVADRVNAERQGARHQQSAADGGAEA